MSRQSRYRDDAYDTADAAAPYCDSLDSKAYNVHAAAWSSRYTKDSYFNEQKVTLDKWDREHDMEDRGSAARVMFNTLRSKMADRSNKQKPVFGPGFSFRKNHVYGRQHHDYEEDLRNAWKEPTDDNVYGPFNGGFQTWKEIKEDRRKRRCCAFLLCFFCFLVIFIPILTEVILAKPDTISCPGCDIGEPISIYALSDTPYNMEDARAVFRSISLLSEDAAFMVHLGNVQDASATGCDEQRYDMAADLLKRSALPILAIPGNEDWLECPDPPRALDIWRERFVKFERFFDFPEQVFYNEEYPENFAVLRSGVLFVGLHLVTGPSVDPDEWEQRRVSMLKFYFGMANMNKENFRAVVLMGNSSEKPQIQAFFDDLFTSLGPIGKPVLYLHGNPEDGREGMVYQPFEHHPTLFGIQVNGQNAATRIDIGKGPSPFSIAQVDE